MKKFHLQLVLLLFAVACHSPRNNDHPQLPSIVAADTLWQPTSNAKLDSLLQLVAVAKQDTVLAKLYYNIGIIYQNTNNQKAKEYYLKIKDLSEKLDWNNGYYLYTLGISDILNLEGLHDSSIVVKRQCLELAKKEMNEARIAHLLANMGINYFFKKWYETALNYFNESLSIFEKRGEKFKVAQICSYLAALSWELEMQEESLMYSERALNIFSEKPDTIRRSDALNNYALALIEMNQLEKAESSLMEALRISTLHNNKYSFRNTYSNLGYLSSVKFDLDNAELYTRKALEINEEFGDAAGCCITNRILSDVELFRMNFVKSEEYAMKALKFAVENDLPVEKTKCYDQIANLSTALHDFRKHQIYKTKADSIANSLIFEKTRIYAKEMEAKYETEKKELEIERQQNIIARQTMQRNLFAAGVAMSVVFLALLWYMLRLRTRRNNALSERNDILAEMNATKDKFFNIISHDLRNPAVALRDAVIQLIQNARFWDAETQSNYFQELRKSAEGQVELIYNLLGWAQLQTGRMTYSPQPFILSALIPDISLIRKMAENKGIICSIRIPNDVFVIGDSNMLATVVRNLMTNAVKYTEAGGQITLDVSPVSPVSPKYTVTVSDTGIGMSEEQIRNLFRIDSAHSRKGTANESGSGLGLIVCRELLEKHGSVLHVESEVGKGSRFWFELSIKNDEALDVVN